MTNVYYSENNAAELIKTLVEKENIPLEKDLPIKIHPGAIGNTSYIKPDKYTGIIEYLKMQGKAPYFIETCMEAGASKYKLDEFKRHGFGDLPVIIADGPDGADDVRIEIKNGKHLKYSLIGKRLAEAKQVLVVNHFKGHCMSGFAGAIKMLGIGFASGRGKTLVHGVKSEYIPGEVINWEKGHLKGHSEKWVDNWDSRYVSCGTDFRERVAESAWSAVQNKQLMYITFANNIVNNCDCDGKEMTPVYKDVGIFASTDPVAIDKAVFEMLEKREGAKPFEGDEIFGYAEEIGLGNTRYNLINL